MLQKLQRRRPANRLWLLALWGICLASLGAHCDARAVNVSNTWTMPQEGLNVFYRFFRDRISWFEADAVCQFHHANLVTVDNSFQFDATRDLLRELDVNDIVWIGLMRPQNSERFMWSNSRPLVVDTGYWAESLPLMDAPLCAVIDPIRDYRWHALRCGGPETASFLCEMPVPSWADACILKEMPNLTMQYMADTASIELIRNCQEEGLLRHSCKGKEDRAHAIKELICPKERLEAQRINDIANSHFKSLQIINNIRTDNNENNDIELQPNYGKLVMPTAPTAAPERFSLDKLMLADAPMPEPESELHIPDEIPMPVKKSAKKASEQDEHVKKLKTQQQQQQQQQNKQSKMTAKPTVHLDMMMMGDQPALSEEQLPEDLSDIDASNEIFEALPHKKKTLPQDLKTMPIIVESTTAAAAAAAAAATTTPAAAATARTTAAAIIKSSAAPTTTTTTPTPTTPTTPITTPITTPTTTTTTTATAVTAPLAKATTSAINITLTTSATEETDPDAEQDTATTVVTAISSTSTAKPTDIASSSSSTTTTTPAPTPTPTTVTTSAVSIGHPLHPAQQSRDELAHPHAVKETVDNSHFIPPMLMVKSHYVPPGKHGEHGEHFEHLAHLEHKPELAVAAATTAIVTSSSTTAMPATSVAAEKTTTVAATTTTPTTTSKTTAVPITTTAAASLPTTTAAAITTTAAAAAATPTTRTSTTARATTAELPHLPATSTIRQPTANESGFKPIAAATAATVNAATATPAAAAAAAAAAIKRNTPMQMQLHEKEKEQQKEKEKFVKMVQLAKTDGDSESEAEGESVGGAVANAESESAAEGEAEAEAAATTRRNFLQEETETPFKPNRRRSLTKPETVSYFKKILG